MLAFPILGFQETIPILTALWAPSTLTVLLLGIISAVRGNRIGLYSTIAWSILLLGISANLLVKFEMLPLNFLTDNAASAGFLLMMLTLSFFIAAEYRRQTKLEQRKDGSINFPFIADEVKSAKNRVVNEQMEEMVNDRTADLESALEELSQANEALKEINTMDAVTGIKNRHYFDTVFEQE